MYCFFVVIISVSVYLDEFHVQLSEGERAGGTGSWESRLLHLGWTHWLSRALLEVRHLQWEAEDRGGTVP